jgi:hypothetical protein
MRTVTVNRRLASSIAEAERCWYDTSRWASWIDGVDRVLEVTGNWPGVGASVVWESGPAGRGRVTERVVAHEVRRGQMVEVEDPSIRGRQTVTFAATEDGAEVSLSLEYQLVRRSIVWPIVDLLFIRRAMVTSLNLTLSHFAAQLAAPNRARPPDSEH